MNIKWEQRTPKINYDEFDTFTSKILKIRGIEDEDTFLYPSIYNLNSPFLFDNMEIATRKIINAIQNNIKIGIYADIDADGVTSLALTYNYLKNFTDNIEVLYHQRKDGHGVKPEVVFAKLKQDDLLIVVDSSTNSVDECRRIKEKGINIIILDHHEKEDDNPYATIVNHQIDNYPNKSLSGVGVCFQLCRAIDELCEIEYHQNYYDLVAVGLIGDMMDVTNPETRAIISEGLKHIHSAEYNKGLYYALKALGKNYMPNSSAISFYLAPLINSTIRLGKIELIIELLISKNEDRCIEIAKECKKMNDSRKTLQKGIVEEIENIVDTSNQIIMVDTTNINMKSGMNGLIAGDLAGRYGKPTLVVTKENGLYYGSARGTKDIPNFKDLMESTFLFEMTQGHNAACGVEFTEENTPDIINTLNKILERKDLEYKIEYDLVITEDEITWDLCYEMQKLSFITGVGFEEPLFLVENISFDSIGALGKEENHMKGKKEDFEVVKFFVDKTEIEEFENSTMSDILINLDVNSWYNFGIKEMVKTKQGRIKDIVNYSF